MKWSIECEQILASFERRPSAIEMNGIHINCRHRMNWSDSFIICEVCLLEYTFHICGICRAKPMDFTIYRYVDNETLIRSFVFFFSSLFVAVASTHTISSIVFVAHAKSYANFEWDGDHRDMYFNGETASVSRYHGCQCLHSLHSLWMCSHDSHI